MRKGIVIKALFAGVGAATVSGSYLTDDYQAAAGYFALNYSCVWEYDTEQVQVGTEKVQVGTEKVQVGTEKVKTGTKHHDEVGHYECSCGATK